MSIIRFSYYNTGIKGTPIKRNELKLSIAYTADRDEAGQQHVRYGIAACNPIDTFKRTEGRSIAQDRLDSNQSTPYSGSLVLPTGTTLNEIPEKIREAFYAKKKEYHKANPYSHMSYEELLDKYEDMMRNDPSFIKMVDEFHKNMNVLRAEFNTENPELIRLINKNATEIYGEPLIY